MVKEYGTFTSSSTVFVKKFCCAHTIFFNLIMFVCEQIQLIRRLCTSRQLCIILDRIKRIWYLSPMRAAKVQASLHIRAVSPEPPLLAHPSSESIGTFRQKTRSLVPLNGLACAVKICHDGMLEDTNSLDGAHIIHNSASQVVIKPVII